MEIEVALLISGTIGTQDEKRPIWRRPLTSCSIGAPAGIRTPNQQIMRRFEGHQQGETKRDNPIFTESAAVKVCYISLRLSTPSRHNRAILFFFSLAFADLLGACHRPL
jgi:hypothetical protein